MRIFLLLLASVLAFSCNSQTGHDLKISNYVKSEKTIGSKQFEGSRVFITPPTGYNLVKQIGGRYQKNSSTYLQVIEVPNTAFIIENIKAEISKSKSSGKLSDEYYSKEFKFGPYQAIILYGADTKPNQEQIVLAFGNDSSLVLAVGEFPKGDLTARGEILQSLLTIYIDTSLIVNTTEPTNFSIELNNSDFKYVGNVSQVYFYNYKGEPLDHEDEAPNQIMISVLPAQSKEDIKEFGVNMIARYKRAGMVIPDYKGRVFSLNGNYAYEIEFEGSYNGKKNSVYQVVVADGNSSILYLGSAYDDRENLIEQIKQIAQTIFLK